MPKQIFNDNISILSAMLAPSMREIFKDNLDVLKSFISIDTLKDFEDIEKIMPKNVTPEGLNEVLELKGLSEFDRSAIVKAYSIAYSDNTMKIAYDDVRSGLFTLYLNSLKGGSVAVIDAIKQNKLYFPEYGVLNDEYSRTVNFADIKMSSIDEMLGRHFPSSIPFVNSCTINGAGYYEDQVICILAPPGYGKSLLTIGESISALLAGFRVHYSALGDLSEMDFIARICTNLLNLPMMEVYSNLTKYYSDLLSKFPELNNLTIELDAPGVYTIQDWIDRLKHSGALDKNDVFVVDYDENFKSSDKASMYESGGEVYNGLATLAKTYHKIIIVVAQPKPEAWRNGINLNSLAESSKKQKHLDMIIGLSPDSEVRNNANITGTISILKNRRGSLGRCFYLREPTGKFSEISKTLYDVAKDSKDKLYYQDFVGCGSSEFVKLCAPDIMDDIADAKSKLAAAEAEKELAMIE